MFERYDRKGLNQAADRFEKVLQSLFYIKALMRIFQVRRISYNLSMQLCIAT
jgi:hypothetical protein